MSACASTWPPQPKAHPPKWGISAIIYNTTTDSWSVATTPQADHLPDEVPVCSVVDGEVVPGCVVVREPDQLDFKLASRVYFGAGKWQITTATHRLSSQTEMIGPLPPMPAHGAAFAPQNAPRSVSYSLRYEGAWREMRCFIKH